MAGGSAWEARASSVVEEVAETEKGARGEVMRLRSRTGFEQAVMRANWEGISLSINGRYSGMRYSALGKYVIGKS